MWQLLLMACNDLLPLLFPPRVLPHCAPLQRTAATILTLVSNSGTLQNAHEAHSLYESLPCFQRPELCTAGFAVKRHRPTWFPRPPSLRCNLPPTTWQVEPIQFSSCSCFHCAACSSAQLFLTFFKTLVGKQVTVELKNSLAVTGTLHSVDQYMNFRLDGASVVDEAAFPQLMAVKSMFIRGSTVRYVHLSSSDVDTDVLQDAARKAASGSAK